MLKPIESLNNEYFADEKGNIYSKRKKIMKPYQDKKGYLRLDFKVNKKRIRNKLVHRLIALTFIPNPNNLPQVNHKDENKQNNEIGNLEWCTNKYNANYGTRTERIRQKHIGKKYTEEFKKRLQKNSATAKKVLCYDKNNNFIKEYCSLHDTQKDGFDFRIISAICHNKRKQMKDIIFKFKEV